MGLGKPQLHAKFEVAGFIYYGNIREFVFFIALCIACNAERCISTAIPSVRPSVTRWYLSRRMKIGSRGLHCEVAKHSSFLTPRMVGAIRPLPPKICAQSGPPPLKRTDFDQYLLKTSQP